MSSAPDAAPTEGNNTSSNSTTPSLPPPSSPPPISKNETSPSPPPPSKEEPKASPPPPTKEVTTPSAPPPSPPTSTPSPLPPSEATPSTPPPSPSPSSKDDDDKKHDKDGKKHDNDKKDKGKDKDKKNSRSPPPSWPDNNTSPSGSPSAGALLDGDGSNKSLPGKDGSNTNAVAIGLAAGVMLFLILVLITAAFCYCKKKRKRQDTGPSYYNGGGGREYYNNGAKWQQGGVEHNIRIAQPPGGGGGGWQLHGPPAPLSSDMSSASYSGPHGPVLPPPSPGLALGFNKSTFTYEELAAATSGFSPSNMIGQGGFGYVYKGVLPNGKDVAVKQLKSGSGQGEREFQAEVEIISRVHHRHLVSLVGYCSTGSQRLLIYEFVPNKTLEHHLHASTVMDWPTRLKIAIGSAKGLAYLHEDCHPRIIHRDIKTANILLDYKFEAMVADFGLAKLSSDTNTHVSTRVMGTFGYLAPEYASTGKLTDKSDVFSYGVMLLELISGRRPVDHTSHMDDSLVEWARPMLGQILAEENFEEVADPRLEGQYNPAEMARMIACAAACVRHSARKRPRMSQVVRALEGDMISFDDLSEGVKPGKGSQYGSGSETDSGTYSAKMKQFQKVAMASSEYTGEYTGEYGANPSESSSSSSGDINVAAGRKPR